MATKQSQKGNARVLRKLFAVLSVLIAVVAPSILTSKGGIGFSPILTGSMRPGAQPGDVFVTRLVPATNLKVGEIIAVNNQVTGVYYSHRIAEIRPMSGVLRITTKGDANANPDPDLYMVSRTAKVSKVAFRIPWIGRPMVYMNTVQGRKAATSFLVVANVLALFAFLFRKKIKENFTAERTYRDLYREERKNSEQYREIIDSLQIRLAERELHKEHGYGQENEQDIEAGLTKEQVS